MTFNLKTNNINEDEWAQFVLSHPHGNIFQTPEMYKVYNKTDNTKPVFLAVVNDDGVILGILLAVIQREHSGLLGHFSARSIIIGGPLIKDNNINVLDTLLVSYSAIIKRNVIYSQFRNLWKWSKDENDIFTRYGFVYEEHFDIINNLCMPTDLQWGKLKGNAKNKINKATKSGVTFMELNPLEFGDNSLSILHATYKKAGLPLASDLFFKNAFKILGDRGLLKLFGAVKDDVVIGVRIALTYKDCVYDWYAGGLSSFYSYSPNDLLAWKVIEWGSLNGYSKFDFGGAGKPNIPYGVRDYKLKFGGDLVNYGRFEKVHKPILIRIGKVGLFFLKIINRLRYERGNKKNS